MSPLSRQIDSLSEQMADWRRMAVVIDGSRIGTRMAAVTVGFACEQFHLNAKSNAEMDRADQSLAGTLPINRPVQRLSGLAELFAFLQGLLHSLAPGVVYTDYQCLIDGLERGSVWCTRASDPYAVV